MKLMVIPVGRGLVFSGSQAKNISYSTDHRSDHRKKIFRTLPITGEKYFVLYLRWLGEGNFSVQILCGGSVIGPRLILHQLPLPRKSLKGEKIFWSLPPGGRSQTIDDMESDLR